MKPYIVIPAFNEGGKIANVITNLKSKGYSNIIVVDDGSYDETFAIAKKAGATTLRHMINRGQGAALQTGIEFALEQGAEIIVTFDADGQHSPSDIPKLIKPLSKVDIVLGSRFLNKNSSTPFIRKLFLKGGAFSFLLLYGIRLTDSHNGLRALSRKAARKIKIECDDMAHASEIIDEVSRHKLKYIEVPVKISYSDYSTSKGQSTLNGFRILAKMLINKILK